MLERFGVERFLASGHARRRHSDRYGTLRQTEENAELWLELQNSTPEPDGTYKTYFLRVPRGPVQRTRRSPGRSA
jgi:hypothetical protein